MGNTDLRDLAAIHETTFEDLDGSRVAVDFHNWLYRYLTIITKFTDASAYTTSGGDEVPNLLGIMKGVPKFLDHGLEPVFVFDGEVLELKEPEMQRRRDRKAAAEERLAAAEAVGDDALAARLRARTQRLTPTILETSRAVLRRLDFPVVDAPAEAEAQAAYLAKTGTVDYVCTEDYDALLFGAPRTLRQLTSKGPIEQMDLEETLAHHDISLTELVDIAILCGTDYNDGIHGIGPKTALKRITKGQTVESILDDRDASIPELDTIRQIYLDPAVTDDYHVDWSWDPDLAGAREYLVHNWEVEENRLKTAFGRLEDAA